MCRQPSLKLRLLSFPDSFQGTHLYGVERTPDTEISDFFPAVWDFLKSSGSFQLTPNCLFCTASEVKGSTKGAQSQNSTSFDIQN